MKYQKYKQICRLTFFGVDDEYSGARFFKKNGSINTGGASLDDTKEMKFRFNPMNSVDLSKNARICIESIFVPLPTYNTVFPLVSPYPLRSNSISSINNYDSKDNGNNASLLFTGISPSGFTNPNPKFLYNFPVTKQFLQKGEVDLTISYTVNAVIDQSVINKFHITFIVYDVDEEELLLKDTNEFKKGDYNMHVPQNNGRYYNLSN